MLDDRTINAARAAEGQRTIECRYRGLQTDGWTGWEPVVYESAELLAMFESRVFAERPNRVTLRTESGKAQFRRIAAP